MARARKPDPEPTAFGTFPAKGASLEERARYLIREIGEEPGFLEQWMAHYLAELLERADNEAATPGERSEARVEIARVIPGVWEQRIAREALHVRQRVDWYLRRSDTLGRDAEHLLAPLLADPEQVEGIEEAKWPEVFRYLHTFTELLTRFGSSVASAESIEGEVTPEAVVTFLRRDGEVQELQAALARVVPAFAALEPTDVELVGALFYQTLLAVTRVQLTLLTGTLSPAPPPRARKKGSSRRQRRPKELPPS